MNNEKKFNTILIVGDWVVDEYWFLVRHYSDISSHTGFVHYRLMNKQNDIVTDLCGAGHVARLLFHLRNKDTKHGYQLAGVGLWNDQDTNYIAHLIHARELDVDCPAAKATFRLIPTDCGNRPDIKLVTLDTSHATIRVIRSYHKGLFGLEQINRMDWEPYPKNLVSPNIHSSENHLPKPDEVMAVVIYDLKKGAVSSNVVCQLRKYYPDARWYVKSKELAPSWLDQLEGVFDLLVIGPEVASLLNPWERWLVNGKVTLPSWEIMNNKWAANTVLLSDHRDVISRVRDSQECYSCQSTVIPTSLTQLGWSSAFFAALIFRMVITEKGQPPKLQQDDIEYALIAANEHAGVPTLDRPVRRSTESPIPKVLPFNWTEEEKEWKQATRDHGIIGNTDNLRLDIWRGSTQIPGYVACIKRKKEIIDEIGQRLRVFSQSESNNQKSISILLQADPGSGKTFLAKSLARTFGFSFLGFDITQIVHRDELLDIFDMVATQQANSNVPVLVFVDEINGLVDGSQVYGTFLSPVEDGVYLRRGNAFRLRPCVWVFAGTKLEETMTRHAEKLSDYKSRMTMIKNIDFVSLRSESKDKVEMEYEARLEQVYIGASIIHKLYPDVQWVSYEILNRFHGENPAESPARNISKKVAALRNVQYGQVTRKNCKMWETWENVHWPEIADERPVRLVFDE